MHLPTYGYIGRSGMIASDATISGFAESLKAKGKLPATVESYCRDARDFLAFIERHRLPANKVEPETLLAFQEYLSSEKG